MSFDSFELAMKAPLLAYSRAIQTNWVRCELDASTDHMKTKIANAEQMKVHTMLVIGNTPLASASMGKAISAPSRALKRYWSFYSRSKSA